MEKNPPIITATAFAALAVNGMTLMVQSGWK
jgi:hypothetical protein